MNHAGRDHAKLSASASHRWLTCTPSALLEQQFPDTTSDAAREGTLAHELCEVKLRGYFRPEEHTKRKTNARIKTLKEGELWRDEMMGYTDTYVDYIKNQAISAQGKPHLAIEKRVDLSAYIPDGFGTADCIIICGDTLHVIDFKYGKGVPVGAEDNPQMMLYALGAYESYKILYPVTHIKMSIVQPRLGEDASTWEISLQQLLQFGEHVKERAALAIKGEGEYVPSESACRFCRAKGTCRARAEKNVELAFFTDKKPPLLSDAEVGAFLKTGGDVASWLSDLKDYALSACLAGKEVPGWKAVEGRGSRDWTDMNEAFSTLVQSGIEEAMLWERKPLTLAQIEKVVGKKEFASIVGDKVIKNPGKPALAKESDRRPATTNVVSAEDAFSE